MDWALTYTHSNISGIDNDETIIQSYKACDIHQSFTIDFYLNHYNY